MKRVSKVLKKMGMRQLSDEEGRARAAELAREAAEKGRVVTLDNGRTEVNYDAQGNEVARLFMTEAGEVLGFVESKTWWIDLEKAGVDTPIHEWRHVWSRLYRMANPDDWKAQIELAKRSPLWDEVRKKYPHLKTESAIADEVMSHYDGARGAEVLERDYQRLLKAGVGMNTAAKAVVWKHRVQALLLKGWNWIAKHLFRVKDKPFTSLEDAFKASFGDLMSGRVRYKKSDAALRARCRLKGKAMLSCEKKLRVPKISRLRRQRILPIVDLKRCLMTIGQIKRAGASG